MYFSPKTTNDEKVINLNYLLFLVVSVVFLMACNSNNPTRAALSKEDSLQKQLDRGNYLVNSVVNCVDCHSQLDLNKFSLPVVPGTEGGGGMAVHELIEIPGKIYIPKYYACSTEGLVG